MTHLFAEDNNSNNSNPRTGMLHDDGNIATSMDVVESMSPSSSPLKTKDQEQGVFHEQHLQNSVTTHLGMNSVSEGREQKSSPVEHHDGMHGGEHNIVLQNGNNEDDTLSHRSRGSMRSHGNSDRSSHGRSSSRGSSRSSSPEGSSSSRRGYSRRRRRSTSRNRGAASGRGAAGGSGSGGQNNRRGGGRRRRHRRGGSGGGIGSMSSVSLSPQIGAASAITNYNGRRENRSRSRDRDNNISRSSSSSSNHQQYTPGGHNRQRSRSGTGSSSNSLSPRSKGGVDNTAAGNGELKIDISPRRRRGGGGGGSPRPGDFDLEPSKVLHVRNVGHPVTQGDLLSLLSCFGAVEKVKMFSGQALVQLPSVSIAKATMRHFEEDEEAKIGNKKIYINYSRSKSIEPRDGDSTGGGGSGGAGAGGSAGNSTAGGPTSNGHMSVLDLGRGSVGGLDISRGGMVVMGGGGGGAGGARGGGVGLGLGLGQAGVLGGVDGNGKGGSVQQDSNSPYGHLIMEDHAKLLGLATFYLQTYMLQGGEGAMININQREELADYQRHARHTMGLNGSGHGHGIPGWSGNPTATTAAAMGRLATNMSSGTGAFNLGYGGRSRSGSRAVASESSDRSQQSRRPPPR